jgi:hypothetical protein
MLILGQAVDEKIDEAAERPPLVSLLLEDSTAKPAVTYLKGQLALTSSYDFHAENIFGIQEGVAGDYQDFQIFILKYVDEDQALKWFHNAGNDLRNAPDYSDFAKDGKAYLMTDARGKCVHLRPHGLYILIFVGPREIDSEMQLERVKQRIDRASVEVYPEGGTHEQEGAKKR